MATKFLYLFSEGNANMRDLLGGKGANLAEMTNIGMPVPQGFTITTEACTQYYEDGEKINDEIQAQIMEYIDKLEKITGKKFGDLENPLLVSVRSGARASMPGMMDTILNLGLNEQVVEVIAKQSNNPRWAWDCYRRFIQMYSDVVMEVGKKYFEQLIDEMKEKKGVTQDVDLDANDLTQLVFGFSRDDAGKFLDAYYEKKIYESDPFARLDQHGVGRLIANACRWGRSTNPGVHLGICGEHGGDPSSVMFCHDIGLDYVSCSPFRVPIARLAAAQAAIANPRATDNKLS